MAAAAAAETAAETPPLKINGALCHHLHELLALAQAGDLQGGVMICIHASGDVTRRLNLSPSHVMAVLGGISMAQYEITAHKSAIEHAESQREMQSRLAPGSETAQ